MKKFSFLSIQLVFLMIISGPVSAQMKVVHGNKVTDKTPKNYTLQPKSNVSQQNERVRFTYDLPALPLSASGVLSGLKPGPENEDGLPIFIEGNAKRMPKGLSMAMIALAYVDEAKPLMKISNPNLVFLPQEPQKDELGIVHITMNQYFHGIPVYGSEIKLHGSEEGFDFLNGQYFNDIFLDDLTPDISVEKANQIIKDQFEHFTDLESRDLIGFIKGKQLNSALVIYRNKEGVYSLAYHVTVYPNLGERWEYFIHAENGIIIDKFPSLCKFHGFGKSAGHQCQHDVISSSLPQTALTFDGKAEATAKDLLNVSRLINTYQVGNNFFLIDASRDMFSTQSSLPNDPDGVIWTIDAFNTSPAKSNFKYDHVTSSNNTWVNSPGGVSSHYNGGKAFEYFRIVHNRNSIDGSKGNIISFINVADEDGSTMGNAFWNGAAMFYGNGDGAFFPLARGLDVAGHEMSHGVIQNTANLEYQGESGALNESFADIFGVMIDRDDWNIGEDVVKTSAFPSGALRSMSDPHNGVSTNDFNRGWQPKHYNERFLGTQDNGGVHINSGIPNHAFFLFATAVGKEKAERVFYRALSQYLTKSSKFVDCRVAVVKSAGDLFGTSSAEVSAAKKAFSDVGILGDEGGSYEDDVPTNPGQDFVLFTSQNNAGLFITNGNGNPVSFGNPLSSRTILSKPSISDDGTEIVYVGVDKKMYYININWQTQQKNEVVIGSDPVWRNAIISKDGLKIAAITDDLDNFLYVFDFSGSNVVSRVFELYNPTFTQGITTGDVKYADAMEFDISGEYVMYDAENEITSNSSGTISYWDIGFINVWDNNANEFSEGNIEKLFSALPDNVSVGNPTFSKNSPYIIAFDYIEDNFSYVVGANLETGDLDLIFQNEILGYPSYSPKDNQMMFDNEDFDLRIARINLQASKIASVENTAVVWLDEFRWANWFAIGDRVLSGNAEELAEDKNLNVFPNPTSQDIMLTWQNNLSGEFHCEVFDVSGSRVWSQNLSVEPGTFSYQIPVTGFANGSYFVTLSGQEGLIATKMIQVQK